MATEFVIDGDAGHDPERLPPVSVRIDGEVYQAHCPKDSIGLLYADFEERADDASAQRGITEQTLRMILAPEDAEAVMAKVLDMGNRRVGVSYVMDLAQKVMRHYEPQLQQQREEMGVAEPQNRAQRRSAAKRAPAKKAAAKKTATKKPAAR
ncbi:hypothetical protein [Streptomyces sulphureus]|uniref:hypothetical protein n=1 Tax=Streptomyces sulphureus TaxID=47758 RepID=UPI0003688086|nr:hypothetical protein [Streptomyces sulphureus]